MAPLSSKQAWQKQQNAFMARLNEMRHNRAKTDSVLVCENEEFPVHQTILSAASPYFEAMFQVPMKERTTGRVEMGKMTAESLDAVLSFIYTGRTPNFPGNPETLKSVLRASHLMLVQPLFEYCFQELLSVDCFFDLWHMSHVFDEAEFCDEIVGGLLSNHHLKVFAQSEFLSLSVEELKLLLKPKQLPADVAVKGLLAWVQVDLGERWEFLEKLFDSVDAETLSSECLSALIKDPLITSNHAVLDNLIAIRAAQMTKLGEPEKFQLRPKFDKCNERCKPRLYFIRSKDDWKSLEMHVYDSETKAWLHKDLCIPLPNSSHRSGINFVVFRGNLHFVWNRTAAVFKYSLDTHAFSDVGDLKDPLDRAGMGMFNGSICAVSKDCVQLFDPDSKECQVLASTNRKLVEPHVFQLGESLFACGNFYFKPDSCELDSCESSFEQYDSSRNQWTIVTRVFNYPVSFMPTVYRGELLVHCHSGFYQYNFETKELRTAQIDVPAGHLFGVCKTWIGDEEKLMFMVVPGKPANKLELQFYDPTQETWISLITKDSRGYECTLVTE